MGSGRAVLSSTPTSKKPGGGRHRTPGLCQLSDEANRGDDELKIGQRRRNRNPGPLPLWQWATNQDSLNPHSGIKQNIQRKHDLTPLWVRLTAQLAGRPRGN